MPGLHMKMPVVRAPEYRWFLFSAIVGTILTDPIPMAMLLHDMSHELVGRDEHLVWCFAIFKDAVVGHYVLSDVTTSLISVDGIL